MSKEVGQKFAEALHRLEDSRDLEAMVAMYTEDCEIGNVVVPEKYHGHDGARKFWTIYRDTFGEARSEFRNIFGGESRAALEWTTSGTNTTGGAFSYDGVSVLELEGEKVVRFRAYFDASELGRQITPPEVVKNASEQTREPVQPRAPEHQEATIAAGDAAIGTGAAAGSYGGPSDASGAS